MFESVRKENIARNASELKRLHIDEAKQALNSKVPRISKRVVKAPKVVDQIQARTQPARSCKPAAPSRTILEPRTPSRAGVWPCVKGCDFKTTKVALFVNHLQSKHKLPLEIKYLAPLGVGLCHGCGKGFDLIRGVTGHQNTCLAQQKSRKPLCQVAGGSFPRTCYVYWFGDRKWYEGVAAKSDDVDYFHVEYPESIYQAQTFSTECFHVVSFARPPELGETLLVSPPDDETPDTFALSSGSLSPSSSVLAACGSADLEDPSLSVTVSLSPMATRCSSMDPTQVLSERKDFTCTEPLCNLSPVFTPVLIPASSTGGVVAIKADGDCCYHLAGEIEALCRNPNAVADGFAECSSDNTAYARKKILENFEWIQSHLNDFCRSSQELENKTVETIAESVSSFRIRVSGNAKGKARWGLLTDLAIHVLNEDVRVIAIDDKYYSFLH